MVQDILCKGCQTIACFFFYGTRRFITVLTKARHRTVSWDSRIHFAPLIHICLRSILMLSSHLLLGLSSGLFISGFSTVILYAFLISPIHVICPRPSHLPWFDHHNNIWWNVEVMKPLIMRSSPAMAHFRHLVYKKVYTNVIFMSITFTLIFLVYCVNYDVKSNFWLGFQVNCSFSISIELHNKFWKNGGYYSWEDNWRYYKT